MVIIMSVDLTVPPITVETFDGFSCNWFEHHAINGHSNFVHRNFLPLIS
jgi:hypothetical protein